MFRIVRHAPDLFRLAGAAHGSWPIPVIERSFFVHVGAELAVPMSAFDT